MHKNNHNPHFSHKIVELSKSGYRALGAGDLDGAEACFTQILATEPSNSYALVGHGQVLLSRNQNSAALERFQTCLDHHGDGFHALRGAAVACDGLERFDDAVEYWTAAVRHTRDIAYVSTKLADSHRHAGRHEEAETLYRKAISINPELVLAITGMAHLLLLQERLEEAAKLFEDLVDRDPDNVRTVTGLGNCYRRMAEFDRALPLFRHALKLEPTNFYALYGVADCLRGKRDYEGAVQMWERLLRRDPTNRIVLTRAGDAHRVIGDTQAARRCYERALEVGDDLYAHLGMARLERIENEGDAAIARLQSLLSRNPDSERAVLELFDAYRFDDRLDEGLAMLSRFCESHPDSDKARQQVEHVTTGAASTG